MLSFILSSTYIPFCPFLVWLLFYYSHCYVVMMISTVLCFHLPAAAIHSVHPMTATAWTCICASLLCWPTPCQPRTTWHWVHWHSTARQLPVGALVIFENGNAFCCSASVPFIGWATLAAFPLAGQLWLISQCNLSFDADVHGILSQAKYKRPKLERQACKSITQVEANRADYGHP